MTTSIQAVAAKKIREALKKASPTIKFSVTSQSFSMGNSVDISWTDGLSKQEIRDLINSWKECGKIAKDQTVMLHRHDTYREHTGMGFSGAYPSLSQTI